MVGFLVVLAPGVKVLGLEVWGYRVLGLELYVEMFLRVSLVLCDLIIYLFGCLCVYPCINPSC